MFRRSTSGSYDYSSPLNGATPLSGISFTDPGAGLGSSGSFAYVIRARAGALTSAPSNEQTATPVRRPAAPASVDATPGQAGRVDVSWSPVAAATGYDVYRRTTTGAFPAAPLNGATPVTGATYADTSAVSGTTYVYGVRSVGPGATGTLESLAITESPAVTPDAAAPTVTLADPGSPLRATVALNATAADAGSGVASVRFQRSPAGTGTWTDVCSDDVSPFSCGFDTTQAPDGLYDLRAIALDTTGNSGTSAIVANRIVDNVAPTGTTAISGVNGTGTAGRPDAGDVLTLTFSEPLAPASVLSGWTGTGTPVTVRFSGINDVITILNGATELPLGSIATGRDYVLLGTASFTNSTMVLNGSAIAITLGTTNAVVIAAGAGNLVWTIPAATQITDLAGNPLAAGTFTESGASDVDFEFSPGCADDLAVVADPGLGRRVVDGHLEGALGGATAGGNGLAVEAGGDGVVDRVVAGLDGGDLST